MSRLLNLYNLRQTVAAQDLVNYFSKYGKVSQAVVFFDLNTGFSKCKGQVEIKSSEGMTNIINQKEHVLDGQKFYIADSNEKPQE